jgi:hypothetical protein
VYAIAKDKSYMNLASSMNPVGSMIFNSCILGSLTPEGNYIYVGMIVMSLNFLLLNSVYNEAM